MKLLGATDGGQDCAKAITLYKQCKLKWCFWSMQSISLFLFCCLLNFCSLPLIQAKQNVPPFFIPLSPTSHGDCYYFKAII